MRAGRRARTLRAPVAVAVAVATLAAIASVLAWGRRPAPLAGAATRAWLRAGDAAVERLDATFVDPARPTRRRDGTELAPDRRLATTAWYPRDGRRHPLLVICHGFSGDRFESEYLALAFARLGYVVVAADFPLTRGDAPGGPDIGDVVNQPGDVRFLIDRALAASGTAGHPLHGKIDPDRIGVYGVSLGGLIATLVGFDEASRDPRVRAVASLAGPTFLFEPAFFERHPVPLLLVAGTADRVIDFDANAATLPERSPTSLVVAIRGGTHTGFGDKGGRLRFFDSPDRLLCWALKRKLADRDLPFARLGSPARGFAIPDRLPLCERDVQATSINPLRQQWLVQLAVTRFFEAYFGADPALRAASWTYLTDAMARENPEITATSGAWSETAAVDADRAPATPRRGVTAAPAPAL